MKRLNLVLIAAVIGGTLTAQAQHNSAPAGRPPHGRHGPGPLVAVLDANRDHVISADEIANAATALKGLDKNGDGVISADELCPPGAPRAAAATDPKRPVSPLMLALDANGDGELSAAEIANAATSLKALDLNKDGQLTSDEFAPVPPVGAPHP